MAPMVSIIVPVYNASRTISRCVESILNQQYTDLELFLVDDGSQDDSGRICDAYACRDSRVRVIHKENSGVSEARNTALEQACGTYIQFLDSDDWITPDATSSLVRAAESSQCDLVIADFYRVIGERVSHKGDIDEDTVLTREEFAAHMMENPADFYYGVLWNKLYRRDLIETHHLRLDPDISWCEDFLFNLEYIRYAERFYALQVPIYYYVKTKGSLANQNFPIAKTMKTKLMLFDYYQQFFKTVLDEEEYQRCRPKVYRFLLDAAGDGAVPPPGLPNSKRLGAERSRAASELLCGEGPLHMAYRSRKLLEHFLETAALKNDLSLQDITLLLALRELKVPCTRRDLADFTGLSRGSLSLSLQRLVSKELIQPENLKLMESEEKLLRVAFLPASASVFQDLDIALADIRQTGLAPLTPEERRQYSALSDRIHHSIERALQ